MMNGVLQCGRLLLAAPPSFGFIGGADGPRVMLVSGGIGEFIVAGILGVLVLALIVIFIVRGRRKKRYRRTRKPSSGDPDKGDSENGSSGNGTSDNGGNPSAG